MDRLDTYRPIIERVLGWYAAHPPSHGNIETKLIVDREQDHYLNPGVYWSYWSLLELPAS